MSIMITDDKVKALACMVHESNKTYCDIIGDHSQQHWNEAPEYNHRSAMLTVRAICDNPFMTPEMIHDVWVKGKEADGWVYGPTKDREKKTHPSIVPYADLSVEEQFKDYIVRDTVLMYLNFIGQGNQ